MKNTSTYFLFLLCIPLLPLSLSGQCSFDVDAGPDIYACTPPAPATIQLGAQVTPGVEFTWLPPVPVGLSKSLNPTVTLTAPVTTFYIRAFGIDSAQNLIVNGDFEGGNGGFSSGLTYSPGDLTQVSTYDITPDPQGSNPQLSACTDHTSGSGNMMACNPKDGSTFVWCQTIPVQPNTRYYLSFWVTRLTSGGFNDNKYKLSMDGSVLTEQTSANAACTWKEIKAVWDSGPKTSVEMCIEVVRAFPNFPNKKLQPFALDDIRMFPSCVVEDSVKVFVKPITIAPTANLIVPCPGSPIVINATANSTTGDFITHEWTTEGGNIVSGENTLTPTIDQAGSYWLNLKFESNTHVCTLKTGFVAKEGPELSTTVLQTKPLTCFSPTINLKAVSNLPTDLAYAWEADGSGNIVSGGNTNNPFVNQPGTYTVTITNTKTGCTATAEHLVNPPEPAPVAKTAATPITCAQPLANLSGEGSSTGVAMLYLWTTPNGTITSDPKKLNATASKPGTYILQVFNTSDGCKTYDTVQVSSNLAKPSLTLATPGVLKCGKPDTIALAATFNPSNASLAWTAANGGNIIGGTNTAAPKVNATGTYTLTATDPANGCTATASLAVQSTVSLTATIAPPSPLTCLQPEQTLNATGTATGPNIQYQWTTVGGQILSGGTTLTPIVNAPGTYSLLVRDIVSGCDKTLDVKVLAEKMAPLAQAGPALRLDCSQPFATISAIRLDTLPNVATLWTTADGSIVSGANSLTPLVSASGTYILRLTNPANGCTSTATVPVTVDFQPPSAQIAPTPTLDCATLSLDLAATASSASGQLTYAWAATNGGNILSGTATAAPKIDQPGTYTLVVTDPNNGCTATASTSVALDRTPPTIDAGPAATLTCVVAALDLSATASGANLQYAWAATNGGNILSGAATAAPKIDRPGTYTLVVTDLSNNCTATDAVAISENKNIPTAEAGPPSTLTCTATTATLSGSGSTGPNYSYIWTTTDGNIVSGEKTLTPTVNTAGTYTLQIVDNQNGCTVTDFVLVQKDANVPTAKIQPPATLDCLTPSVQLEALGTSQGANITFTWTAAGGGHFLSGQTSLNPVVDAPGQYILEVVNTASNCTVSTTVTVAENRALPLAQIAPPAQINCLTASFNLDASGSSQGTNFLYTWTAAAGGNIVSGAATASPKIDQPGAYTLLISDPSNGCTATASVSVTANIAPPQVEAGPPATITCTDAMPTLSGSGSTGPNFSYLWTTTDGTIVSGEKNLTPTVSQSGVYMLQIIDNQNGCTATDVVSVQKNANVPTALAQVPGILTCQTTSLQLSAAGTSQGAGFAYQWTATNGGNIVSAGNTLAPVVNQPGTYTLLVSNASTGCTAVTSVAVSDDRVAPSAVAVSSAVLDCRTPSIALSGIGSSEGTDFSYLWTASAGGQIVSGQNTLAPVADQPGQYTLLVTNSANGCTMAATATVLADNTAPTAQVASAPLLDCVTLALSLNASGSAQGTDISYLWTASAGGQIVSGQNTLAPVVDQPGQYTLLVTNAANGCTALASTLVSRDVVPPVAAVAPPALLNCTTTSLTLDGSGSSQGANFTYTWTAAAGGNISSGSSTPTPAINQPGTYNLLVFNTENQCSATATVAVAQDLAKPEIQTEAPLQLNCVLTSQALAATATVAGNNFDILWTTANGLILADANTLTPVIGAAGTYSVMVKSFANGCTQTASVLVSSDQTPPLSAASAPAELTCKTAQTALSGLGSSAGSDFAYSWTAASGTGIISGKNTLAPEVNQPGQYTLLVTNTANYCTSTATTMVLQNTQPPQANAGSVGLLTCIAEQVGLAGSGSGGNSGVAYAWAGPGIVSGASTPTPSVNKVGVYTLLVTDLYNGCTNTAQTTVTQNVVPPVSSIVQPGALNCLDKTAVLGGAVSDPVSGYSVAWTGAGIVSGGNSLTPTVDQPGLYLLLVTNSANGCTTTASVFVGQNIQPPLAKAGGAFELNCTTSEGALSAAGSSVGSIFEYNWATVNGGNIVSGANSIAPMVDAPGLYTLTVKNLQNHCTATDEVEVTQDANVPTDLLLDQLPPNCKRPTASVSVKAVQGGTGPYLYSLDGGATFGTDSQFSKIAPGSYNLVVQDAKGCQHEQLLQFDPPVQPNVALGPDVKLTFGDETTLVASVNLPPSQIASVTWSPMEGLTPTADPLVMIAKPLRPLYYTVTVQNTDGCEAKISLRAQVDQPNLWAPNVFSPRRRDGNNDYFLIFASDNSVQNIKTLQIFDRWGNMVFRNDDLQPNIEKMGWDGSFRGTTMQPAVFAWYAEVLLVSGEQVVLKGDVTVVD